jgi:hypothetical protein
VVADPEGNRWEWLADEETGQLLQKLDNEELSIETTDLHPPLKRPRKAAGAPRLAPATRPLEPGARDAGGGFNPYDHAGRPKRRGR